MKDDHQLLAKPLPNVRSNLKSHNIYTYNSNRSKFGDIFGKYHISAFFWFQEVGINIIPTHMEICLIMA